MVSNLTTSSSDFELLLIIPARMGSSRFPGKPLHPINGKPLLQYCIENAQKAIGADRTWVATCDQEIVNFSESIGANVIMTSAQHERASDRVAEAANKIEEINQVNYDIVIMLQGDEPLISPKMIVDACKPLLTDTSVKVTNLMAAIDNVEEFCDVNEVKVVVDLASDAIYFSREQIPSPWKMSVANQMFKQVCCIPFRRDFLDLFNSLEETKLERIESIDMLRLIEHGYKVRMVPTDEKAYSVDTLSDAKKVEQYILNSDCN
jgi:3-deoxy-manno-octulosonate cytidylyltransferase (CMP-KDO synthetase)